MENEKYFLNESFFNPQQSVLHLPLLKKNEESQYVNQCELGTLSSERSKTPQFLLLGHL